MPVLNYIQNLEEAKYSDDAIKGPFKIAITTFDNIVPENIFVPVPYNTGSDQDQAHIRTVERIHESSDHAKLERYFYKYIFSCWLLTAEKEAHVELMVERNLQRSTLLFLYQTLETEIFLNCILFVLFVVDTVA